MLNPIRGLDNFTNVYDYVVNQLLIYDYNDKEDLEIIKKKIMVLDGPVTGEESGGHDLVVGNVARKDTTIVVTTDNGPTIFRCMRDHVVGRRNITHLSKVEPWKINYMYTGEETITENIYNAGGFIDVTYDYFGDVVMYQNKLYRSASGFLSCHEFDNGDFEDIDGWVHWRPNAEFQKGTYLLYNENLYYCDENIYFAESFEEFPCFFEEFWEDIGPAKLWDDNYHEPKDHFNLLLNNLMLLDIYSKTELGELSPNELEYGREVAMRMDALGTWVETHDRITGYILKDYNYNHLARPPMITTTQMESLHNFYMEKRNNNELSLPSDLIKKVTDKCYDIDYRLSEIGLVGYTQPSEQEKQLRIMSQKTKAEVELIINDRQKVYDELHDLAYSTLCSSGITEREKLPFARPWVPGKKYKVGDMVTSYTIDQIDRGSIRIDDGFNEVYGNNDRFNKFSQTMGEGNIWICKYPHVSGEYYPHFDKLGKFVEDPGDNPRMSATSDITYALEPEQGLRIVKFFRHPETKNPELPFEYWCNTCNENREFSLCPICSSQNIALVNETVWIRPTNVIGMVDKSGIIIVPKYNHPTDNSKLTFRFWCNDCECNIECPECAGCDSTDVVELELYEIETFLPPTIDPLPEFIVYNEFWKDIIRYPAEEDEVWYPNGIIPLTRFYHNPENSEDEDKSKSTIAGLWHDDTIDYGRIVVSDDEGDVILCESGDGVNYEPLLLVRYHGMVFRYNGGYEVEFAPLASETTTDVFVPLPHMLDYIDYIGNDYVDTIHPLRLTFMGLSLAPQRDYIGPRNGCCTGGASSTPSVIEPPEQTPLDRRKHTLYRCDNCGYEQEDWACDYIGVVCARCLESTINYEKGRVQLGRVKEPMNCGKKRPWCDDMKIHPTFGLTGLSPTNARFPNPGVPTDTICKAMDICDCEPCYGCWRITPEPMNIPIQYKNLYSYVCRFWINWAYIDPLWICDYIESPDVIWPGDKRAEKPEEGEEGCFEYYPATLCTDNPICGELNEWPHNWANSIDAMVGDWKDIYAMPRGSAPKSGYAPAQGTPDGHNINTKGDYYGTPEEDWQPFVFCMYFDNGKCEMTTAVRTFRTKYDLPKLGKNSKDTLSFERFVVLNHRFRALNNLMSNETIVIGKDQTSNVLENVNIPDLKDHLIQTMEQYKKMKIEYTYFLPELCEEFILEDA